MQQSTTSAEPTAPTEAELRHALDAFVVDALPIVATLLGVLYAVFAVGHVLVLPPRVASVMAATAGATCAVLLGVGVRLRRHPPSARLGPPLGGAVIALVLLNSLLHLAIVGDPEHTTNLMLLVVGAALLLLSRPWFALTVVATAVGWGAVAAASAWSPAWLHFGFALLTSIVLATVVHLVWIRAVCRLERLRLLDEARQRELVHALAASEEARTALEASTRELAALMDTVERSEQRFRRFTVLEGMAIHERGLVLEVNETLPRMLGYAPEQLVGRHLDELVTPESLESLRTYLDQADGGVVELVGRRQDGAPLPLELSGKAVPYEGRMVQVAVFRDVTERRRAEAALRESESRFRQLADSMPHIVWSAGPDGSVDYWNARWPEFLGVADDRVASADWYRVCHPDDRAAAVGRWRAAMQSGEPLSHEYRLYDARTGEWRWHVGRGVPARDAAGRIVRWFGTITDIDDRKRAHQALEESGRRKDRFLALLAHELRNPLASIRSATDVLRAIGALVPRADRAREIIDRQTRHMVRLVDDLLDLARIGSGKIALRPQAVDLAALVEATVDDHREALEAHGLRVETSLAPGPIPVIGDPTRLSQALGNLLQNARKFTPPGGVVRVSARAADDGAAVVAVRDSGIGIEPAMLERIFDSFHQGAHEGEHERGGLGLGLTLARALVELHGGRLDAASEGPGRGATFVVRLPLASAAPGDAARAADGGADGRSQRILVIEDNADAADSMTVLLRMAGHEVLLADTGSAGLELARELRPDVVLCDIGLPGGLDGYAVARALRADPALATTRLVAVTGYGRAEDQGRAREAGFDVHLTKPVDIEQIHGLLAAVPSRGRA